MSEAVKITRDFIMAGRLNGGGWNAGQLSRLGIRWPPRRGWIDRVVGRAISAEDAKRFLARDTTVIRENFPRRRAQAGDTACPLCHGELAILDFDAAPGEQMRPCPICCPWSRETQADLFEAPPQRHTELETTADDRPPWE